MRDPENSKFEEVVAMARQFCRVLEQWPSMDGNDGLAQLYQVLPRLHAAVAGMRPILSFAGRPPAPPDVTELDDRFEFFARLRRRLGGHDGYWLEFDDCAGLDARFGEGMSGSLADDLTDIYFELKRGLGLLGSAEPDQVAQLWQSGFTSHWGQHLVDAERHLYRLRAKGHLQ